MLQVVDQFFRPAGLDRSTPAYLRERARHRLDEHCVCKPLVAPSPTGIPALVDLYHQDQVGTFLGGHWLVVYEPK